MNIVKIQILVLGLVLLSSLTMLFGMMTFPNLIPLVKLFVPLIDMTS